MRGNFEIFNEKPYPLGCYIDYDKSLVVRAIFSDNKRCGITLYPSKDSKNQESISISFPASYKKGQIYSVHIKGIENIDSFESYNYFQDRSFFCDSYAKHVIGLESFGKDVPDNEIRASLYNKSLSGPYTS